MEIKHIKNFWNTLASGDYKSGLVGWYDEHMQDANEEKYLFDSVGAKKDWIVLEVGCGPMRNAIKFKDKVARVDGADVSSTILEKAVIDLNDAGIAVPNLYHMDGKSLTDIPSSTYDLVFMVISHQHIGSRDWRLSLYNDIKRVLKPNGFFTFQSGYGPGHPISVDYFHSYTEEDERVGRHFDVRIENEEFLRKDLIDCGFTDVEFNFTDPCYDQHPQWIWTKCKKA